jgi:hypothetical protein
MSRLPRSVGANGRPHHDVTGLREREWNPAVRGGRGISPPALKGEQNLRNRAMMPERNLAMSGWTLMVFGAQTLQLGIQVKCVMLARETLLRGLRSRPGSWGDRLLYFRSW